MTAVWQSKPFEECIRKVTYSQKIQRKDFLDSGTFPVISQEESFINGYWENEADLFRISTPVILFGDHTKVFKFVDFDFVLGADGVKILQPAEFLVPRFFYYFLMSVDLPDLGYARHYRLLSELTVSYPGKDEQRRIVNILDEAFEGIAAAKANAEKNLQNARALFDSYLDFVFTKSQWPKLTLGDVCKFVGGSQPPKSVFEKAPSPDSVRLIQIRDYKSDKNVVFIPRSLARRYCTKDDVMIGRYGPPIFQILRGLEGAYNVALMKAEPDEKLITKDFLFYFLRHSAILEYVIFHAERAAGQIGLNKETLEPYPIAVPPLADQREIVKTIKAIEVETRRLESIYQRKLAALDELKQSLLHQAFSGAL
jgi:type I restriction enzyme S subunit